MKISFDEISEKEMNLEVNDESWFPDSEFKLLGSLTVHINLQNTDKRVSLKGTIRCPVELECDRCLVVFATELESEFSVLYDWVAVQDLPVYEGEHQLTEKELEVVELAEPMLDIFAILRQQFYLMLPAKSICAKNCKGLCRQCGKNMNLGLCSCSGVDADNPFSILTKLKDN